MSLVPSTGWESKSGVKQFDSYEEAFGHIERQKSANYRIVGHQWPESGLTETLNRPFGGEIINDPLRILAV